jgi:REase associating with pPIWI_RE
VTHAVDDDTSTLSDLHARYLVTKAAIHAAKALTSPGRRPEQRLETLMECHGSVLAARGPGSPLPFGQFRDALSGDLAQLLPDGVDPIDLKGLSVVDPDGQVTENAFDLDFEQRMLLHTLHKLNRATGVADARELREEVEQETVYQALKKQGIQSIYENGREDLIRVPAGPIDDLADLRLPPSVVEFYQDIPYGSTHQGWWYPCPICRWPMRLVLRKGARGPEGSARCWHAPHADMGSSYLFRPTSDGSAATLLPEPRPDRPAGRESVLFPDIDDVPQPIPADKHKALVRGVWRYTTVPGIPELALRDELQKRGLKADLWPSLDAYDLLVTVAGTDKPFKVDVKDYTSATTLGSLLHAQEGDRGGAEWLVVPDYRAGQIPLLSEVCARYGMKAATASVFAEFVCTQAGVRWA